MYKYYEPLLGGLVIVVFREVVDSVVVLVVVEVVVLV